MNTEPSQQDRTSVAKIATCCLPLLPGPILFWLASPFHGLQLESSLITLAGLLCTICFLAVGRIFNRLGPLTRRDPSEWAAQLFDVKVHRRPSKVLFFLCTVVTLSWFANNTASVPAMLQQLWQTRTLTTAEAQQPAWFNLSCAAATFSTVLFIATFRVRKVTHQDPTCLLLILSSHKQKGSPAFSKLSNYEEELQTEDIEAMKSTNWAPIVKAIQHHQPNLKRVYLLTTPESSQEVGQARRLIAHLTNDHGLTTEQIKERIVQNPEVLSETIAIVNRIYNEIVRDGFAEHELIADITGGTKPMSAAVAIATLPSSRRVQYLDQKTRQIVELETEIGSVPDDSSN